MHSGTKLWGWLRHCVYFATGEKFLRNLIRAFVNSLSPPNERYVVLPMHLLCNLTLNTHLQSIALRQIGQRPRIILDMSRVLVVQRTFPLFVIWTVQRFVYGCRLFRTVLAITTCDIIFPPRKLLKFYDIVYVNTAFFVHQCSNAKLPDVFSDFSEIMSHTAFPHFP